MSKHEEMHDGRGGNIDYVVMSLTAFLIWVYALMTDNVSPTRIHDATDIC
ncbi:hypothetical protein SCAR479_06138 [Seiridium cardinale]|uniref:Uncharacterized protein n=1 Tax=Seiridium cardinale TaxID=138064 RepID=A0ABR2XU27_9PEZI